MKIGKLKQLSFEDIHGVPSAHDTGKMFHPKFDGEEWTCDCTHFICYHTACRHILIKQLEEAKHEHKGGVRETSILAYLELMNDPDQLNDIYQDILITINKLRKPSTDREIASKLDYSDPNKIRPRRNELADPLHFYHPLIREVGKRECEVTRKLAYVWELTDYGRLFL